MQCGVVWRIVVKYCAVWYHLIKSVALNCSEVQCGAVWFHVVKCGEVQWGAL